VRLTPVSADYGPGVCGPSPARFLDSATDRQIAQLNQILGDPGEPDCVIRCPQIFGTGSMSAMVIPVGPGVKPPPPSAKLPPGRATVLMSVHDRHLFKRCSVRSGSLVSKPAEDCGALAASPEQHVG
jgi:hypothetical protein